MHKPNSVSPRNSDTTYSKSPPAKIFKKSTIYDDSSSEDDHEHTSPKTDKFTREKSNYNEKYGRHERVKRKSRSRSKSNSPRRRRSHSKSPNYRSKRRPDAYTNANTNRHRRFSQNRRHQRDSRSNSRNRHYSDLGPDRRRHRHDRSNSPPRYRNITSAKSGVKHLPLYSVDARNLTPEQKLEMALNLIQANKIAPKPSPIVFTQQKLQEIKDKRKLLWSKDDDVTVSKSTKIYQRASSSFAEEDKEKFSRLMGLKSDQKQSTTSTTQHSTVRGPIPDYDKTKDELELQYEASRRQTHMMKGSGLGYSSNTGYYIK